MITIAADPKHLGARIGVTAVLHMRAFSEVAAGSPPVGLLIDGIAIKDPGCVAKTYPSFWRDLSYLGAALSVD